MQDIDYRKVVVENEVSLVFSEDIPFEGDVQSGQIEAWVEEVS